MGIRLVLNETDWWESSAGWDESVFASRLVSCFSSSLHLGTWRGGVKWNGWPSLFLLAPSLTGWPVQPSWNGSSPPAARAVLKRGVPVRFHCGSGAVLVRSRCGPGAVPLCGLRWLWAPREAHSLQLLMHLLCKWAVMTQLVMIAPRWCSIGLLFEVSNLCFDRHGENR